VTRTRLLVLLGVAFAVGALADVVVGYAPFPGYGAAIGIVGTLVIAVLSSVLTRLAARPEDHYPAETPRDVEEDLRSPEPPVPAPGATSAPAAPSASPGSPRRPGGRHG
jgi:hypothetical protein